MQELIYVVDDQENILEIVSYNLEKNGFRVKTYMTGQELLQAFSQKPPDLLILDLMLPDMDGLDICKRVKKESQVPIIILSAKSEELDKVLGLELGADDYMIKPFGIKELVARVKSVLRRFNPAMLTDYLQGQYELGKVKLSIDEKKHEIFLNDKKISLNPKEFRLLSILLQKIDQLVPRQDLIREVWGPDYYGDTRTLDVHIRRIRKKMSDCNFGQGYLQTVHGYGYKLVSKLDSK
ncbi:MAG: response regulator transcription factor [Actinomycetota bacterium]|nr:response regulator transcription factor [Actinomycetota bacterium]